MNLRSLLIFTSVTAVAGLALVEAVALARQREELARLHQKIITTRREIARLQQPLPQAAREAKAALDPAATAIADPARVRRELIREWVARAKRLKQLFAERPEQNIPEMALLADDDWLRVARLASFEDEHATRKALGALRTSAKSKFANPLGEALSAFARASGQTPPDSIAALAVHFKGPVDASALQRYEIGTAERTFFGTGAVLRVRERAAVDPYYDSRHEVVTKNGGIGWSSRPAPMAWTPDFNDRFSVAAKAYSDANQGRRPGDRSEVYPYFNPPLDAQFVELLKRFDRER